MLSQENANEHRVSVWDDERVRNMNVLNVTEFYT